MEKMLNEFKNKLLDLTTRNRSLCLRKHYKGKSVDMFKLINSNSISENAFLDFLLNNDSEICLINNVERVFNSKKEKLYQAYLSQKNNDNNDEFYKTKEYLKLNDWNINLNSLKIDLKELHKNIVFIEKETGKYELYLGYPFVEGNLGDDKNIKAPIWLFPVQLNFINNSVFLNHLVDSNPVINNVLLLAYHQYNNLTPQNSNINFDRFCEWLESKGYCFSDITAKSLVDLTVDYLDELNIFLEKSPSSEIEIFKELKHSDFSSLPKNKLFIRYNLVLGQFPLASSLYNDYVDLLNNSLTSISMEELLKDNANTDTESNIVDIEEQDSMRKYIYFYTKLDYSQESAVVKSMNNNLVIYGPPGTGKSETIANIVVDNLLKDKKVLIVSQKKAALDVLLNRLAPFDKSIMSLTNVYSDKKRFYHQIQNALETYEDVKNNRLYSDEIPSSETIENISNKIEDKVNVLWNISNSLQNKTSYGLTLYEMFTNTSEIKSTEDDKYKYYIKLYKNNLFLEEDYTSIKNALRIFDNNNIIKTYYKTKDIEKDCPEILNLRNDLSIGDTTIFLDSFEVILDKVINLKSLFLKDDIFQAAMKMYFNKNNHKDFINEEAKKLNEEHNGHLLDKLNDTERWNPIYWVKYISTKKQEKENINKYNECYTKITDDLEEYIKFIDSEILSLNCLKPILNDESFDSFIKDIFSNANLEEKLNSIKKSFSVYSSYSDLKTMMTNIEELQEKILNFIYNETSSYEEFIEFGNCFLEVQTLIQIELALKNNDLKTYLDKHKDYEYILEEINNLYNEKRELVKYNLLEKQTNKTFNVLADLKSNDKLAFGNLKKESKKSRCLKSIRQFIEVYRDYIFDLYPCWVLNPETVSDVLPLEKDLFDIIIFDEASQLLIEKSIPSIYRAKQVIVAGDDKQLKPSTLFNSSIDFSLDEEEFSLIDVDDKSLLDIAKKKYEEAHLSYHYRSKYEELINFSNYAFYSGKLQVSPNIDKSPSNKPIERIEVNGVWKDNANEVEADAVVELLYNIFSNGSNESSVGIITFNEAQKQLIERKLELKASEDEAFSEFYFNSLMKIGDSDDKSLFVKNIENVQGDERDIIIFSIGYAKDKSGNVYARFGSLNQASGENRLNVAISRAKTKIYVVTSIKSNDLVVSDNASEGARLFKKYLQYVELVAIDNSASTKALLHSLCEDTIKEEVINKQFKNSLDRAIYDKLTEKGFIVHTQVGTSGYSIDLAIYDTDRHKYLLGIECDGTIYRSSKSTRERDVFRQIYLTTRGWNITRIWSVDWWANPDREIDKILLKLENIK